MPKKKEKLDKLTEQEKELLGQAREIYDTINTKGWNYIANFITNSISWPDPKVFHSREEAIIPYSESYGASELAKKIGYFINSQEDIIKTLTNKLEEESDIPNYNIGE